MIVGPGNLYVQEAKRQVADRVGIDGFAGPSDLLVIFDAGDLGSLRLIALDLIAQAEHGAASVVIAVAPDPALLEALAVEIEQLAELSEYGQSYTQSVCTQDRSCFRYAELYNSGPDGSFYGDLVAD